MFCFKACSQEVIRLQEENARLKADCDAQISHYVTEANIAKNRWRDAETRYTNALKHKEDALTKIVELEKKLKADYHYQVNDAVSGEPLFSEPMRYKRPSKKKK